MPSARAIALLVSSLTVATHAGVYSLAASKDNTLYENPFGDLSNGAGDYCFAGLTAEPRIRRALVAFDVQSAIPPGATILECSLTMHMSKTLGGAVDVSIHRVLSDWGEGASHAPGEEGSGGTPDIGDATWLHTEYETAFWNTTGGDFDAVPTASASVGGIGDYTWGPNPDMTAQAQGWLDGTLANHGWMLIGDEANPVTAKRFNTRDNADSNTWPQIRIVYRPACVADWNSDGTVNTSDVLGFLNEWAAGEISADLNFDGTVNTIDMLNFLNAWNAGC